jgi:hypothetical protein
VDYLNFFNSSCTMTLALFIFDSSNISHTTFSRLNLSVILRHNTGGAAKAEAEIGRIATPDAIRSTNTIALQTGRQG